MCGWSRKGSVCEGRREKRKEETGGMGGRGVWVGVTGAYWCLLLVTSGGIRPEREPKSDAGADFGSGNGSKKKREGIQQKETRREGKVVT